MFLSIFTNLQTTFLFTLLLISSSLSFITNRSLHTPHVPRRSKFNHQLFSSTTSTPMSHNHKQQNSTIRSPPPESAIHMFSQHDAERAAALTEKAHRSVFARAVRSLQRSNIQHLNPSRLQAMTQCNDRMKQEYHKCIALAMKSGGLPAVAIRHAVATRQAVMRACNFRALRLIGDCSS